MANIFDGILQLLGLQDTPNEEFKKVMDAEFSRYGYKVSTDEEADRVLNYMNSMLKPLESDDGNVFSGQAIADAKANKKKPGSVKYPNTASGYWQITRPSLKTAKGFLKNRLLKKSGIDMPDDISGMTKDTYAMGLSESSQRLLALVNMLQKSKGKNPRGSTSLIKLISKMGGKSKPGEENYRNYHYAAKIPKDSETDKRIRLPRFFGPKKDLVSIVNSPTGSYHVGEK